MTYFDKHIWGYAAVCCLEMIHFWGVYHVVSAQQYQNTKHKWILLGFSLWLSGYFTIWKPWPFLNCIEYRWMMIDLLSLHLDVPVRYNQIFETNPNSMEVSMGKSSNYVAMWRIFQQATFDDKLSHASQIPDFTSPGFRWSRWLLSFQPGASAPTWIAG